MEVLPDERLQVTPAGETSALPGNRRLAHLIREEAKNVIRRHPPTLTAARRVLTCQLGKLPLRPPEYRVLRTANGAPGRIWSRFALETEPSRIMAMLKRLSDREFFHLEPGLRQVKLYVADQDAAAELANAPLPPPDAALYALDVRGIGDFAATGCDQTTEQDFFSPYGVDYHFAALGTMTGDLYLAGKVRDVAGALALLNRNGGKVELEAHGLGCIPALLAVVMGAKAAAPTLRELPPSWEEVVQADAPKLPMSYLIPGILKTLDLPDLCRLAGQLTRLDA